MLILKRFVALVDSLLEYYIEHCILSDIYRVYQVYLRQWTMDSV